MRKYRLTVADQAAWDRAHRPKTCKLRQNPALARIVASKLQLDKSLNYKTKYLANTEKSIYTGQTPPTPTLTKFTFDES